MTQRIVLAMLLGCATYLGAQQTRDYDLVPNGKGWGEAAEASKTTSSASTSCSNGICYHGGPVLLKQVNAYYIWYGNWVTGPKPSDSQTTVNILDNLITAGAGATGGLGGSPYEHINTTYFCSSSTCSGSVSDLLNRPSTQSSTSVTSYPPGSLTYSKALSDSDIQTIVHSAISGGALPADPNGIYFVLTSSDVNETSGFCTQYCGWHNHGSLSGIDIKYAFVGNPDRCPSACEAQTTVSPNNDTGADGMASIIAHESEEAISDPDVNAWFDRRGGENADKCAWTFGCSLPGISGSSPCPQASNGAYYNITLGGNNYLIQRNWVNAAGGSCAMSF